MSSVPKGLGFTLAALLALVACGGSSGPLPCSGACACATDADCSSGQTCVGGFCATAQACNTSSDCADPNATCVNGSCVDSTSTGSSGSIGTSGTAVGTGTSSTSGRSSTGTTATTGHATTTGTVSTSGTTGHVTTSTAATSSTSTSTGATSGTTSGTTSATTTSGAAAGSTSGTTGTMPTCTSNAQCTGGLVCVGGSCVACTADSQCGPPSLVCASGVCSQGCFPGTCPSGELCDDVTSGRCVPATGTTATGSTCTDGTDCVPQGQSSVAGVCVTLPSGSGSGAICSSLCEATDQCPSGMVCANFPDPVGFCLPDSVVGVTGEVGTSTMGQTCSSGLSCDSVAPDSCDLFNANSNNDVCSDTCAGNGVGCTNGWSCITLSLFYPDAGASCRNTGTCTDPNSGCFTDGRCHQEILTDECVTPATTGAGGSGASCEESTDCNSNFCNGGTCVDPCCRSTDCPSGEACEALVGPSDSIVMGCVANTGSGGLGATCDTGTPTTCQSGFCIQNDPYDAGTAGYCADTCCSDAECGTGYACNLLSSTLPDGTTGLVPFCLKL